MRSSFLNNYDNYAAWIARSLKLWDKNGRDTHHGYYEHLLKTGQADKTAIRRHRIQARQVFTFASGHKHGWFNGLAAAEKTFEFMCLQGWTGSHFIHKMDGEYNITDGRCDLYDHAFYLLAAAALYDLTGQTSYAQWIDVIIKAIDALRHEQGGWAEDNIGTSHRRQNPHMHLFEVHLYLYEITGDARFMSRANESLTLFKTHFYEPDHNRITEFFNPDWTAADTSTQQNSEPGHAAEWIWLLGWYDRLTGQDHKALRYNIFDNLSRQAGPYLVDHIDGEGQPLHGGTRRLWVQTEWIKAHIALHEDGYSPAAEMLPALLDHFISDYLTEDGLWRDQFNMKGEDISATIPTSTQYHIIAMIMDLKRVSGG